MRGLVCYFGLLLGCVLAVPLHGQEAEKDLLTWSDEIPPLPDSIGVAGPFVGVHGDALVVAGERISRDPSGTMTRFGMIKFTSF